MSDPVSDPSVRSKWTTEEECLNDVREIFGKVVTGEISKGEVKKLIGTMLDNHIKSRAIIGDDV